MSQQGFEEFLSSSTTQETCLTQQKYSGCGGWLASINLPEHTDSNSLYVKSDRNQIPPNKTLHTRQNNTALHPFSKMCLLD
ncbi:hypothetical protein Y1Q_0024406 [Alligator mississippiensis]|uniref:Uncharacterized protein n=1 Tax=Alligator mississippiensis TaxID=8496 RepID=A0A151M404_ALLMI|nr:hypothetical protein Y1Q_0024406 [Alligator mississippiensis]